MSRRWIITLSIVAALAVLGTVAYALTVIAQPTAETGPNAATDAAVTASGNLQASNGGGVELQAMFDPEANQEGALVFLVTMNTHSVELGAYDLAKLTRVVLDDETALTDVTWQPKGQGAGHHVEGTLTVQDSAGLLQKAKAVTLEVTGLPGPEVRRLTWQVPAQ